MHGLIVIPECRYIAVCSSPDFLLHRDRLTPSGRMAEAVARSNGAQINSSQDHVHAGVSMVKAATGSCDDLTRRSPHMAPQQQDHSLIKIDGDNSNTQRVDPISQKADGVVMRREQLSSQPREIPSVPPEPATTREHRATDVTDENDPGRTPDLTDAGARLQP